MAATQANAFWTGILFVWFAFQIIYRALCDIDCGEELLLRSVDSVGADSEEDEGIAQEMAEGKTHP